MVGFLIEISFSTGLFSGVMLNFREGRWSLSLTPGEVVWGVTHALHTPLMAVTNAISGLTAAGGGKESLCLR